MDIGTMPTEEELLEKGQTAVANTVKSTSSNIVSALQSQVGISKPQAQTQSSGQQSPLGQIIPQGDAASGAQKDSQARELTKEMVQDLYAPSSNSTKLA